MTTHNFTRRRLVLAMVSAAAVILASCAGTTGSASAAENAAETLLSRNASYTLAAEGFMYVGQVQPGVNLRPKEAKWVETPLVEGTDTGDLLIDGKTDPASVVYTPWYWSSQVKQITVAMTLPGRSRVSRVVVVFPEEPVMRAEAATLFVKTEGGVEEIATERTANAATNQETAQVTPVFALGNTELQEIKVVVMGVLQQFGIAELEVYGDGPTPSDNRGLVRSKPHLETMTPPKLVLKPESVRLTEPRLAVTLSGTPLTSGSGAMLVDGNRTNPIRIDSKPHSHTELTADIDLGAAYLIDAINVWMPGGNGSANGHIHDLAVAVSPTSDGADWQVPTDTIANPYLPGDDAPKPYAIPINGLNTPGRRVRVMVTLSGTGGVTNRLALSEIEVWGRAVDKAALTTPQLNLHPIRLTPAPLGELHPKLQWLTRKKVRAAWIGDDLFDNFEGTHKTKADILKEAGFNLVRVSMGPDRKNRSESADLSKRLAANVKEARRVGSFLLIGWQYGSTHEEPYRRYRAPSGRLAERSCCPLDDDYIVNRHIGRWAVAIARGDADGMAVDTEMYESDETQYPGPCVCDVCFSTYLCEFSSAWKTHYDQIPPERRGQWLSANGATEHYSLFRTQRTAQMYDKIRKQCQEINPAFLFAHPPGLEYLPGIERGLGTPTMPCLVFSEREYTTGPSTEAYASIRRIRSEGIPRCLCAGCSTSSVAC